MGGVGENLVSYSVGSFYIGRGLVRVKFFWKISFRCIYVRVGWRGFCLGRG